MATNADTRPQASSSGKEIPNIKVYERTLSTEYNIYLPDIIRSDSTTFLDVFNILSTATADDEINIHMANYGGSVQTGFRLARNIKNCAAPVIMRIEGNCYSMGAILALCGNGLAITTGTELMFHNFSAVHEGKGSELNLSIEATTRHFVSNLRLFCMPFLTSKEVTHIMNDQDLYIEAGTKEFLQRIERHFGVKKRAKKCNPEKPSLPSI